VRCICLAKEPSGYRCLNFKYGVARGFGPFMMVRRQQKACHGPVMPTCMIATKILWGRPATASSLEPRLFRVNRVDSMALAKGRLDPQMRNKPFPAPGTHWERWARWSFRTTLSSVRNSQTESRGQEEALIYFVFTKKPRLSMKLNFPLSRLGGSDRKSRSSPVPSRRASPAT
jgi:hypothetical protein